MQAAKDFKELKLCLHDIKSLIKFHIDFTGLFFPSIRLTNSCYAGRVSVSHLIMFFNSYRLVVIIFMLKSFLFQYPQLLYNPG